MPKVWIVNLRGHNYRPAEEHGELKYITVGYVSQGSLDGILYEVVKSIAMSEPGDFLLPSGMLPLNLMAVAAWWHKHKSLTMLLWDHKRDKNKGGYRKFTVDPEHLDYLFEALTCQEDTSKSP